jgi:hypothetical protein
VATNEKVTQKIGAGQASATPRNLAQPLAEFAEVPRASAAAGARGDDEHFGTTWNVFKDHSRINEFITCLATRKTR